MNGTALKMDSMNCLDESERADSLGKVQAESILYTKPGSAAT
jgi:hypothetical protein